MAESDFFGNLLMQGINFGSKYLSYATSEESNNDSKNDLINSMLKNNQGLLNRPAPMNPVKDQIKRAEAVGLDLLRLKDKDKTMKYMDEWIGVTNGR